MSTHAFAAREAGGKFDEFDFDSGDLGRDEVEIDVRNCGICHSDLSMLNNEWGMTAYPFVGGHEVVGTVAAFGEDVAGLTVGQTVGLGWWSKSCMSCSECMAGDHNLCTTAEATILGRHGGFADKVRASAEWVLPLPEGVNDATAGPLFCGGVTVFNPIIQNNIQPTDRVGVVGIGGLGHMALRFLKAWGCHVTAFSTSPAKEEEARGFGAYDFVSTNDGKGLQKLTGSLDMILVTVNVELDWDAYIAALKPKGVLHIVGAAPKITASVFPLILGQKSISASPSGSAATLREMLEFCGRHRIEPQVETFPMSGINEAFEKLHRGKPRYRIVLENDLK